MGNQPFDLTELDWTPELWVACHDNDERNAALASHLWEDNGLDVPQGFLAVLLSYLGTNQPSTFPLYSLLTASAEHENAYVRSSCASSIATALEHWTPQIASSLAALEELYREKVRQSSTYLVYRS